MKEVKAILTEKVSSKGNNYTCIEVYITPNIKKMVFLTQAELELLKLSNNQDLNDLPSFR